MASSERTRGVSLRARLAFWMLVSAVSSLLVFASTAYVVVSIEEHEDLSLGAPPETPSEIATETAEEVAMAMAVAAPVALLISVGAAIWISRRTLAPLYAVVRTANEMGARDLQRGLEVPVGDPALAELVMALNKLFERLASGFGALERYATDASHELRTPLAVVASELEVALRRQRSSAQWQKVAETALDEVHRLTRLVESLLALARLDTSPLSDGVPFDLQVAVEQALAIARPQAEAARLSLTLAAHGGKALVVPGNADAVATALASLVANAMRYTPAGGVVQLSVALAAEDCVEVCVDDSGPGVSEAEREAIFEPFRRGSAGRAAKDDNNGKRRGLGLGLAMVRRVAKRHGGSITVGSSPLGGARFALRLPTIPR